MLLTPPKNEIIWVAYAFEDKIKYVITSLPLRDVYYLCEVNDNKCLKTKKKAKNPMELEKYIYGG